MARTTYLHFYAARRARLRLDVSGLYTGRERSRKILRPPDIAQAKRQGRAHRHAPRMARRHSESFPVNLKKPEHSDDSIASAKEWVLHQKTSPDVPLENYPTTIASDEPAQFCFASKQLLETVVGLPKKYESRSQRLSRERTIAPVQERFSGETVGISRGRVSLGKLFERTMEYDHKRIKPRFGAVRQGVFPTFCLALYALQERGAKLQSFS